MVDVRKRFYVITLFLLALLDCAHAQFIGFVSLQSEAVQILNASSSTGRTVANANIGASTHLFTYCFSNTVTSLQVIVEGSFDGVSTHFAQLSPVSGFVPQVVNGNNCGVIRVGGYYNVLAFNVLTLVGGNISVWYSSAGGPIDIFPPWVNSNGAASGVQCDQSATFTAIAQSTTTKLLNGNANQTIYICGGILSFAAATTAGTISFLVGTGATCGGAPATIPFDVKITANTPQQIPINQAPNSFYKAPATIGGANLCVVIGAVTAATDVTLNFAQF